MPDRFLRLAADDRDPMAAGYVKDKTLRPGEGHGRSSHDHAVLTLVVHGRLDESFSGERQSCSSWELHYKPPGVPHATATGPQGARMLMLALRPRALTELGLPEPDGPRNLGGGARAARALATFEEVAAADRIEAALVRRLWPALVGDPVRAAAGPAWIGEVRERAARDLAAGVGLAELAAEYGMHPVYLARAFRARYGTTIGAVRRQARVDRAVDRLTAGRTPLSELALDLGYADQSHFSREFKKLTGWSPGRFRRSAGSLGRLAPA